MNLQKYFHMERDFNLFLLAGLFSGVGAGIYTSIFNNYLSDIFKLSEDIRGFLEVPREAPGFFIMLIRIAMFGMAAAVIAFLNLVLSRKIKIME